MHEERTTSNEALVLLVIDDNPDDIEVLRMAAEPSDPPVWFHVVESTHEALAHIEHLTDSLVRPSAVILDWSLPGGSHKLLEILTRHPVWQGVPVVVYSGSDDPDDMARAKALGAAAFEVKPTTLDGVTAMLDRVAELARHGSATASG